MHQSNSTHRNEPPIRAVPMSLFPTMDSLQDVVDLAESKVPVSTKNEIRSLLFTYHNSLLKVLNDAKNQKP